MRQTISYRGGYIHLSYFGNIEVIRVQVDAYAYPIQVKSLRAAKILISKHSGV